MGVEEEGSMGRLKGDERFVIGGFSRQLSSIGTKDFVGHLVIGSRFATPSPRSDTVRRVAYLTSPRLGRAHLGSQIERANSGAKVERMRCMGESMASRDEALHGQILALSLDLPKSRRPPPRPPPTAPGSRLVREVRDTDASRSLLDLLLSHPRPRKADKAFPASPRVHTPSGGDGETRGKARARQLRRLKTSAPFLRAIGAVAGGGGADENLRAASPPAQQHFYRGMEDDGAQRRSERHGERPATWSAPRKAASLMCPQRRRVLLAWACLSKKLQNQSLARGAPEEGFLDLEDMQGDADAVLKRILKNKNGVVGDFMSSFGR